MEVLRDQIRRRIEALPGGWCTAGKLVGMDRVALYRAFKMKGHAPTLVTLMRVAPIFGLKVVLVEE